MSKTPRNCAAPNQMLPAHQCDPKEHALPSIRSYRVLRFPNPVKADASRHRYAALGLDRARETDRGLGSDRRRNLVEIWEWPEEALAARPRSQNQTPTHDDTTFMPPITDTGTHPLPERIEAS